MVPGAQSVELRPASSADIRRILETMAPAEGLRFDAESLASMAPDAGATSDLPWAH